MNLTIKVWRQANNAAKGEFKSYPVSDVSPDSSFLEMLDELNNDIIGNQEEPIAFDHDCREGICGSCSLYIQGEAHGPMREITTCQLHMRSFKDGETIYIEPWRAKGFPVVKPAAIFSINNKLMPSFGVPTLVRTAQQQNSQTKPLVIKVFDPLTK